ncbi:unnamed protein product, partial [Symbiodinium sp. KB8]
MAFPLLIFNTIATAELGSLDLGVIGACSLAKATTVVNGCSCCYLPLHTFRYPPSIVIIVLIFKLMSIVAIANIVMIICIAVLVLGITWLLTYCAFRPERSHGQRILTSSVFAFFAIASDDFAIGFPVIDALYGKVLNMGIYIAGNALVAWPPFACVRFC